MLWLTTVNPTFNKKVEIWGGGRGMGGEDDAEKVGRTPGKILATPLLKPEKNNRSLEKRPYHLSGVVLSEKR